MNIPKTADLMPIYCGGTNKGGNRCGQYLGQFQTEGRGVYGDFYCKTCKSTEQCFLDEVGILNRDSVPPEGWRKLKATTTPVAEIYVGR